MNITTNINGNDVKITLTKEQLDEINKQIKPDWRNIKSLLDAVQYLGNEDKDVKMLNFMQTNNNIFDNKTINQKSLEICIKAVNELKVLDWSNKNQYKYRNWFEYRKNIGWVFGCANDYSDDSVVGGGFYLETKEKAEHCAKYFIDYYKTWLTN
jgi:hypothetical protein